jgi:hypothetical protein
MLRVVNVLVINPTSVNKHYRSCGESLGKEHRCAQKDQIRIVRNHVSEEGLLDWIHR